jgi:phosphatidylglycerol lysyltransferase
MLLLLLPSRSYFYRKSSLFEKTLTPNWIAAIAVVIAASIWLAAFSYKHQEYATELWWQFDFYADAPRSLRATAGLVGTGLLLSLWRLLRPSPPEPTLPAAADLNQLVPIIRRSSNTSAHLALLGDKEILHSASGNSFLMYGIAGPSWVACGDPVGPVEEWKELIWQFHEMCDRHGGWTVFYQVSPDHLPLYLDLGLSPLKIGEEARVSLRSFSLEGAINKPLRHWHRKPESEGCTFEILQPDRLALVMPVIRTISDAWLEFKNTREKRFSLGFFDEKYLERLPLAIVRQNGKPIAFANLWAGDIKEEISVDLMRHMPDCPAGVMDYLLIEIMLWGSSQGYQWFNLGMAPLAGLESRQAAPFWNQLGTFVYHHGGHFYNFEGLRRYKDKFRPVWEPKYLVSPGGVAVFRVLTNIASMISGGFAGVVTK